MRLTANVVLFLLVVAVASAAPPAPPENPKDALAQCEEKILQKIAVNQAQYANELATLMKTFQAKGDLDNLLLVKQEQERLKTAIRIEDLNIVQTPVELRNLQLKYQALQDKITQRAVKEFLGFLEGQKKKLTIEGKIDEAVALKQDIENIQLRYPSAEWPDAAVEPKPVAPPPLAPVPQPSKVTELPFSKTFPVTITPSRNKGISILIKNNSNKSRNVSIKWKDSSDSTYDEEIASFPLKVLEQNETKAPWRWRGLITVYVENEIVATYNIATGDLNK